MKHISMKEATRIAKDFIPLDTLQPRSIFAIDFHTVGCRSIYLMLDAAYLAGQKSTKPKRRGCPGMPT